MKRLIQTLAVFATIIGPIALSGSAYAASTCQIGYTGPDSNNLCTSTKTVECTVINTNNVTIDNENLQVTTSGNAGTTGNTSAGSSTTGTATNKNGATFSVTIKNTGDGQTCVAATTVPATVTPSVPTVTPSGGSGATTAPVTPVAAPQQAAATVLPNTAANPTIGYVAGLVGLLGFTALGSRAAVATYNRLKS
jgi:hypothetical protein